MALLDDPSELLVDFVTNKPQRERMADFDPEAFLPYLLNRAAEAASLRFAQVYKDRFGLLRTDWRVLFHLGHYGPMTARDIGARAGIHKTKISRAVSRLEERRFLAREKSPDDRRVDHLSLTRAGRAAYAELSQTAADYDAQLTHDMTPAQAEALRGALKQLAAMRPALTGKPSRGL